jgi:KaiC/GvpD/RAD55 family RecA-like ATPase
VFELVPDVPEPTRAERLLGAVRQGDDVLNKPRTSWLVRNLVPTSSWGILYGPPGGGKSFYGLTFALELARGGRWAGQEIEPEKVLYIAAERAAVLGDRQEAWQRHHRQPIPGNFHELVWAPQLHKGEDLDDLVSVVAAIRPRLVIIDTLAQCSIGLEENGTQMGYLVSALDRVRNATDNGSVLGIHHTGKDVTKGMRGSSILLGAADYTLEISGDATAIRAQVQKLNASAHPYAEWYKLEGVNMPPLEGDDEWRSGAVLVGTTGKDVGTSRVVELLPLMAGTYKETGITRSEVDEVLSLQRSSSSRVLATAKDRGWLTSTGKGPTTRYYITEAGLEECGKP